ncbi:MAG: NUDIX domain-containing protein [Chloroflexia bacterium]
MYLVADELRGMSALMREFAADVYTRERADRLAELALKLAAIAEEATVEEVRARFPRDDWSRVSPAVGVEAAVFDETGGVLLVRRRDNGLWALPGGIAEIGQTLPEAALRELWEEAGLRGEAVRLLGVFDGRLWGSRSRST